MCDNKQLSDLITAVMFTHLFKCLSHLTTYYDWILTEFHKICIHFLGLIHASLHFRHKLLLLFLLAMCLKSLVILYYNQPARHCFVLPDVKIVHQSAVTSPKIVKFITADSLQYALDSFIFLSLWPYVFPV